MTDSEKRKLIRNVKAEVRGALLRRWCEDADLIYNVRDTLDPSDPLASEIFTLGKDAAWIRGRPRIRGDSVGTAARRRGSSGGPPDMLTGGTDFRERYAREREAG